MDLQKVPSLTPVNFFHIQAEIKQSKGVPTLKEMKRSFLLPTTSELLAENSFAEVAASWNEEGLVFGVFVDIPLTGSEYPDYDKGDAVSLFIDTRDLKESLGVTRFSHHFLILPEKTAGIQALELSRFRAEDSHPLCDPEDLSVQVDIQKKSYALLIQIPKKCLVGYDPFQINHIGFTYTIHRHGGKPQHFAVSSFDYAIEQYPKLWSSLLLK